MKTLTKHTAKTALAVLLVALVNNTMATEFTISATTTLEGLEASDASAYIVAHPGHDDTVIMLSGSNNTLTLEDESSDITPTLSAPLVGGGSLTSENVSGNTTNVINTAYSASIYAAELSGSSQLEGDVFNNTLNVTSSAIGETFAAVAEGVSGNMYGNAVSLTNSSSADTVAAFFSGSTGSVTNNTVTMNNSSLTGDTQAAAAYVYKSTGDASYNTLTATNGSYARWYVGAIFQNSLGSANSNSVSVSDSSSLRAIGVYLRNTLSTVCEGTVNSNTVVLDNSGITSQIIGAYVRGYFTGEAAHNSVTLQNGSQFTFSSGTSYANGIYGAYCDSGSAYLVNLYDNHALVTGGSSATNYVAGAYRSGSPSDSLLYSNSATVEDGSSVVNVYGAIGNGFTGQVYDNAAVLTDSSASGNVAGAYTSGACTVTSNSVLMENSSAVNVYGARNGSAGTVADNTVSLTNSTASGNVFGGYSSSGSATGNTVTLDDSTVAGNVYGGYVKTGSGDVTGNTVVLKSTNGSGDLSAATIYGGGSSVTTTTISDNTLKMENYSGTVAGVAGFDTIVQNGGDVTITNGKAEAGKSLSIVGESADKTASLSAGEGNALTVSGSESVVVKNAILSSEQEVTISGEGSIDLEDSYLSGSDVVISDGTAMRLHNVTIIVAQGGTADLRNTTISGSTSVSAASPFTLMANSDDTITVLLEGSTVVLNETNSELISGEGGNYTINASSFFDGVEVAGSFTLDLSAYSDMLTDFTSVEVDFEETAVFPEGGTNVTVAIDNQMYATTAGADGGSVSFTQSDAIPEPTTATLSLLTLVAMASRRRRK